MIEPATLLTPESVPFTTGVSRYYDSPVSGVMPSEPRIFIRLDPGGLGVESTAMVDTGAPWCILEPKLAEVVRDQFEELPGQVFLSSRLGRYSGSLYLGIVKLPADLGEDLSFLDRIRFAFDPHDNMFHFGP